MRKNHGSLMIILGIIVSILTIGGIVFYFFVFDEEGNNDLIGSGLEDSIISSIANSLNVSKKQLSTEIIKRNGIYATGKVLNNENGESKYFYVVFAGGVWRLVSVENNISCERLASLGFDESGSVGCVKRHANARTVAEVLDDEGGGIETFIGFLSDSNDPSGNTVIVSSFDKSVIVDISKGTSDAKNGDLVIVTVESMVTVETPTETTKKVVAKKVENVGDDKSGITEPQTSDETVFDGFNIFDINQSDLVRLRND